jgi:hypothetical protein
VLVERIFFVNTSRTLTPFQLFDFQYVNRAAITIRGALKEPALHKAQAQSAFSYNAATWQNAKMGTKTRITTMDAAGKS